MFPSDATGAHARKVELSVGVVEEEALQRPFLALTAAEKKVTWFAVEMNGGATALGNVGYLAALTIDVVLAGQSEDVVESPTASGQAPPGTQGVPFRRQWAQRRHMVFSSVAAECRALASQPFGHAELARFAQRDAEDGPAGWDADYLGLSIQNSREHDRTHLMLAKLHSGIERG
jgi:hypothetical protein